MGYAVGDDTQGRSGRFIGYGVPAKCDHPDCDADIDRGFAYSCGDYDQVDNCGLHFCGQHLDHEIDDTQVCERCGSEDEDAPWFEPKPDTAEWINHILSDESWEKWRAENPELVEAKRAELTQ